MLMKSFGLTGTRSTLSSQSKHCPKISSGNLGRIFSRIGGTLSFQCGLPDAPANVAALMDAQSVTVNSRFSVMFQIELQKKRLCNLTLCN